MRPSLLFATSLTLSSRLRNPRASSSALRALATTRRDDGTIVIAPDPDGGGGAPHTASVILCHGLGDTAEGWADPARYLASRLPHVKFILPTAPTQPVTLNMGMAMPAWYDIIGLDERSNEVCDGLDDSVDRIVGLIEDEVRGGSGDDGAACGPAVDYSRIVLAGFSQGGALALYAGMTQFRKGTREGLGLPGILVMSGYLPRASQLKVARGSEGTPILHCHGEEDPVVPVKAASLSRDRVSSLVSAMGADEGTYEVRRYPGLAHSVSMEELDDAAAFLGRVLPPVAASDDAAPEGEIEILTNPEEMSVAELMFAIRRKGLGERARGMIEKSELVTLLRSHAEEKGR